MANKKLAEEMKRMADGAVKVAKKSYQLNLNYSVDSLRTAEKVLSKLHEEVPKRVPFKLFKRGGMTEQQIMSAAMVMGAYVGEVIRRIHGGEWVQEDIQGQKDVIFLRVNGNNIFPIGKVYRRIKNGPEDDIYFYYQVLVREVFESEEPESDEAES
ncbi:MAG: hypothetical protein GX207_11095 [Peptococcaceae bacterium]|nr:hypothetical protein [Peptococcaceae bacterium]